MRTTRRMIRFGIFLIAAISSLQADMLPFYWHSFRLFDRVVAQARETPTLKEPAFHFLRLIAEGRKGEMSPELLAAFSYREELFAPLQFPYAPVRARAFEQIGRLATPEALAYLESVDVSQFLAVEDQPMAAAIPLGIFLARVAQITDSQRRWEFYAETLRHPPEGLGRDGPLWLAERGLCTEGALSFLPDVEAYARRWGSQGEPEDDIRYCKEMMNLAATHVSRIAAFEAALYMDTKTHGKYFHAGAINLLSEIYTKESQAALTRFAQVAEAKMGPTQETRNAALRQDPSLWTDLESARLALAKLSLILSP